MRIQSNKNKGRLGQQEIQKLILKHFPGLSEDDCRSNPMGSQGEDILLSPEARKYLPYNIEVKRKKKFAVSSIMDQAAAHGDHTPLAFLREDRGEWFAVLPAEEFFLLREAKCMSIGLRNKLRRNTI